MSLLYTLTVFFVLLAIPPLIEKLINQTVTSRALLGSIALVVAFTAWHWLRSRREIRRSRRDAILRRRALLHLNDQRGEVDWRELFWLLLAIGCFGFLILTYVGISLAAEPVHFNSVLSETSDQLKESVPLSGDQFGQLTNIALAIAVLEQELSSSPSMMSREVRETRVQIKRRLKSAHETLVEAQILHSAAVVRAIAKDRK